MGKMTLDFDKYCDTARRTVAEGQVLLKNENKVLPLPQGARTAVFGRIQTHYYKSGTGSGGMVNVDKVTGILEALLEDENLIVNQKLLMTYRELVSEGDAAFRGTGSSGCRGIRVCDCDHWTYRRGRSG